MTSRFDSRRSSRVTRCAYCDGKFGLVRYYSWRAPLCSKKCVARFKSRRENYFNWAGCFRTAFQLSENGTRAL